MRSYTVEGIVIKRSNLGEGDKIITLFTRSLGKISSLAKGVRKISSRRAGSLELFNLVKVSLHSSRGGLDILGEVDLLDSFSPWKKHFGRTTLAYQLIEAVDKLTPDHEPHPEIFEILRRSLKKIGSVDANWKQESMGWLVEIASELGYWPKNEHFDRDIVSFIEDIISRPLNSPKLLDKLR